MADGEDLDAVGCPFMDRHQEILKCAHPAKMKLSDLLCLTCAGFTSEGD